MNKKKKSKAFTLTELLVVVVVIGVLSAVVLPKFSKVIETRRTTEAEELMASIRTEQERRCALDKKYITDDISKLNDIVKNPDTKNYRIELASTGIRATRKDTTYNYTLQMPSYADGRICCDSEACEKLNKNYPTCDELRGKEDYQTSPESCAGATTPEPPAPSCDNSHKNGDVETKACECGVSTASWTCNASTGYVWKLGNYSACAAKPKDETKQCDTGYTGTQTRSAVCKNGAWAWGEWSGECSKNETSCPEGKVYDEASGKCMCDTDSDAYWECQDERECLDGSFTIPIWHEDTCTCEDTCPKPSDTPHSLVCSRVSYQTAMQGSMVLEGQEQLSLSQARQACEIFGKDVSVYEAIMGTFDCSDPRKPCTQTPSWGKHWTCQEGKVTCGAGLGMCDPCTCICGVG